MRISRRQYAFGLAGVACLAQGAAALGCAIAPPVVVERCAVDQSVVEQRIYAPGSVLPPVEVLRRNGIRPRSMTRTEDGTVYLIPFDTLEARVKAWDRFNTDENWCVIRDRGTVALHEVRVYPAGKIFEISL
jgi:hypothetical protein